MCCNVYLGSCGCGGVVGEGVSGGEVRGGTLCSVLMCDIMYWDGDGAG
jgi:hypothetical protein